MQGQNVNTGSQHLHRQHDETAEEYHNRMTGGGSGSSGGSGSYQPPPPPPKFKDMNGTEWDTQAEADASNEKIKAAMAGIEGQVLTSDSTYERWLPGTKMILLMQD
jgi:hypothetical protein